MYLWRKLTPEEQASLLAWRKQHHFPWHSPPHPIGGRGTYILSAACLNHAPHIGRSHERMAQFCQDLLNLIRTVAIAVHAWCVLPNHYHLLVTVNDLRMATRTLGKLHGRTAFLWNKQEGTPGRQVWHATSDRLIRSSRHFWATINYIHYNPVHHGYVARWDDWPYSSVHEFLKTISPEEAARIWREYPIKDYGKGWDEPKM